MCLLQMKEIDKSFYGVQVLKKVDFRVGKGQIHGLLGENGAGKSTLMNILGGVISKDAGTIRFDGKGISRLTPAIAQETGIGFVHQELNLFNDLCVYENIFLQCELLTKWRRLDKKRMVAACNEIFQTMGVAIDPLAPLYKLDAAKKQLVEIAKVLRKNAKLIIMDEPTTSLNQKEIETLFAIMANLKEKGTSFVYISHKIPEVMHICDWYSVLRNGAMVETGSMEQVTGDMLVAQMLGGQLETKQYKNNRTTGQKIMTAKDVTGPYCAGISFHLKQGEVIAFTGLEGNGGSELLETIFGYRPMLSGYIEIGGKKYKKINIQMAMKQGVALIPKNRKENGIIPDMHVLDNLMLSQYALKIKKQQIHKRENLLSFGEIRDKLSIKVKKPTEFITTLSGGNQQKVIIGRWLQTGADIFLFDHPTQGIDVGAKEEVYKLIQSLAQAGKSIVIHTMEIPEIQKVADRCYVLYQGRIVKTLLEDEITEENIMRYGMQSEGETPYE